MLGLAPWLSIQTRIRVAKAKKQYQVQRHLFFLCLLEVTVPRINIVVSLLRPVGTLLIRTFWCAFNFWRRIKGRLVDGVCKM